MKISRDRPFSIMQLDSFSQRMTEKSSRGIESIDQLPADGIAILF